MYTGSWRLWSLICRSIVLPESSRLIRRPLNLIRTMSASGDDLEKNLENNPYFGKYETKIRVMQRNSPDEFKARLEEVAKPKAKPKDGSTLGRGFSALSKPVSHKGDYQVKKLDDIMKTELLHTVTVDTISKMWKSHFESLDAISATIPSDLYNVMHTRGKKYPVFVLPVPREQGYEFFVSEVLGHEICFTTVLNYQAHKENAPVCLKLVHYTELQDRGIVLMHGEFDKEILNVQEAQCLANQIQLYYGKNDEKKIDLLMNLNNNPTEFKHIDLIVELENLSL